MVHDLNYRQLRRAAYTFANAILAMAPDGEEQQEALRKVREALLAAKGAFPIYGSKD